MDKRLRSIGLFGLALCASGCGARHSGFDVDGGALDDAAADTSAPADAARADAVDRDSAPRADVSTGGDDANTTNDMTIVYAHSDTTLYAVDPHTNAFSTIGLFAFPSDGLRHTMTDIAVDAVGNLVGVTGNGLYQIDVATAACTNMATLPGMHSFVGLTYVPVGVLDPNQEVLIGGATDGTYWRIDTTTGATTMIGTFQNGWGLSGDFVSIAGAATYATVRQINGTSTQTDHLATIDPATGAIHVIGDTGVAKIYGLGYWRATLYGFTHDGRFLTIDVGTGRTHQVAMPVTQFSGAGVTTLAPYVPG